MPKAKPLPVDHPGTFIAEELEARGWMQADLAYILSMDGSQLNRLIKGNTDITPDSAVALGDAFDMPAEFFMNLTENVRSTKGEKSRPRSSRPRLLGVRFPDKRNDQTRLD